jgi:hypothetical protein
MAHEKPTDEKAGYAEDKVGARGELETARAPSFDEKEESIEKTTALDSTEIGEVFADGPRLIDLGEDGRERPIGELYRIRRLIELMCCRNRR